MGGVRTGLGYTVPLLVLFVQGVRGEAGVELTSLIVAGVLAGVLCVILLFVIPVVCYIRRRPVASRREHRKKRPSPRHIANGDAKHKSPREQNGIPLQMMNGVNHIDRQNFHRSMSSLDGKIRVTQYGGPKPMIGTFRGPPPQPIIIGAPPYPAGRGSYSRANPYVSHMGRVHAPYPPMGNPYFFRSLYPVPIVYVTDSDDSESDYSSTGRSTMRERKSRYQRQFTSRSTVPSSIVIKSSSSESLSYGEVSDEEPKRPHKEQPVPRRPESPLREQHVPVRSTSRSRSRSPAALPIQLDPVRTTMYPEREQQDNAPDLETFQAPAGPKSGDVTFAPQSYKPQVREESPTQDYLYASVIKPTPEKPAVRGDSWGEPDADLRPPSPKGLGMSMSERLQGIVEDGWGSPHIDYGRQDSYEMPSTSLSQTKRDEDVVLRQSRRDDDIPRESRRPEGFSYRESVSTSRQESYAPPSPPLDIPSSVASPRQSFIRDQAFEDGEQQSNDRPITPPFDANDLTPKPSFRERPVTPPPKPVTPKALSQSQNPHRNAYSNDVLKELKLRQKSVAIAAEENPYSTSINPSSPSNDVARPDPVHSQESVTVPSFNGVPGAPPVPPPPPPLPKFN